MKVDAERQKRVEQTYRQLGDIRINVLWQNSFIKQYPQQSNGLRALAVKV